MSTEMVTGKVLAFPGQDVPAPVPVETVVAECERLLQMAKEGKLVALGAAMVLANGHNQTSYTNDENYYRSLVATSDALRYRLLQRWLGDTSYTP
jgi:hypothetical protein